MNNGLVHEETREGFDIKLYFLAEHLHPDDLFDYQDKAEQEELLSRIEDGILLWFCAKVTASKDDIELGTDYRRGCCYESVSEFLSGSYYDDMVNEAVHKAKAKLKELSE